MSLKATKLGSQAVVLNVDDTEHKFTNVNVLAANLANQICSITAVTKAVVHSDLQYGPATSNTGCRSGEGGAGGGQLRQSGRDGGGARCGSIAVVMAAVKQGELTQKVGIQVEGEMATLKDTVNRVVDQLSTFASEITRVMLEVGMEGILSGQAVVTDVQRTWADLTRNVNNMATSLKNQVRSIAEVTKATAQGDFTKTVNIGVQGKMLDLTVNSMVRQLTTRFLMTEGILRGQAVVADVEEMWKILTDNVNLMAISLMNQVCSIAEVTKAVMQDDLTKKIQVDVRGEILKVKVSGI
ncbi:hypothetical protein M422DRAFT_253466 [Sphaerobolus stellatus SS14]|uniref:HAMP domain-containing protein n=1 Tax=Sphaerobolus stellatus (strain SS14) TaxID=990650 RepID=A0A0C9UJM8_SPHS4|nr:hypothetical protein M422DRAFT_253466 [Sphaerobolus stellatus SS14]